MIIVDRIRESRKLAHARAWVARYECYAIPGALLVGVAFDFLTFRTLHIESAITLLYVHLQVAFVLMVGMAFSDEYLLHHRARVLSYARLAAPFVLQISLGALLGASFIFYWFSGSLSLSWPILLIVAAVMVSNETMRDAFQEPRVQWSVFTYILIAMGMLILPFWTNRIGWEIFVLASVMASVVIMAVLFVLQRFVGRVHDQLASTVKGVALVVVSMGALYALNIIPPIPLSVRTAGVYHDLYRDGSSYRVLAEHESVVQMLIPGQRVHAQAGERLFVYAAVFAPAHVRTRIVHEWQSYDPRTRQWMTRSRPSFVVSGGREQGYRGYSYSDQVTQGLWRVNVQTEDGRTLGRLRFRVLGFSDATEFEEMKK